MSAAIQVSDLFYHSSVEDLAVFMNNSVNSQSIYERLEKGLKIIQEIENTITNQETERVKLPQNYEYVYPLTPIESGMIYSSILSEEIPVYYDQFNY